MSFPWYIPSWNGDYRLEPADDGKSCVLIVVDPTPAEKETVVRFLSYARERKWTTRKRLGTRGKETKVPLKATVTEAAPVLIDSGAALKIGALTVLRFSSGEMTAEENPEEIAKKAEKEVKEGKKKPKAAATVKRPTSCCPSCIPGAIEPATEVLLAFLTPEQHRTWADGRYVMVQGGLTGYRYAVAHRHSEHAREWGKVCRDVTHDFTLHFHDTSVPPEEEVLGTMLILQHREHWLRHEATCLGLAEKGRIFKNPFGDFFDGVQDAAWTAVAGRMVRDLTR